jgi:hypothetical protein
MKNYFLIIIFASIFVSTKCLSETNWVSYIGFVSEVEKTKAPVKLPLIDKLQIDVAGRQMAYADLVELWEECKEGWLCIETPTITYAIEKYQKLTISSKWKYADYSFSVRDEKVRGLENIYIVDVTENGEELGTVLHSSKRGIIAFTVDKDGKGKFDAYWLDGEKGIFSYQK